MITFTCDRCKKTIDAKNEIRFVISIEVQATLGAVDSFVHNEHLDELSEALDQLDSEEQAVLSDHVYENHTFDLCECCREEYCKNLLNSESAVVGFSDN